MARRDSAAVALDWAGGRFYPRPLMPGAVDYADFFEGAPIGLHVVAADGFIVHANQAELDVLGYTREQYIGHHVSEFFADTDVLAELWAHLRAGKTAIGWYVRMRCGDGATKHVVLSANGLWRDGQLVCTRGLIRDVSAQIETERQLALLIDVGRALTATLDPEVVWRGLAQSAQQLLRADNVVLYRTEPGTRDLIAMEGAGTVSDVRGARIPLGEAAAGLAAAEARTVFSPSVLEDPHLHLSPEIRSWLSGMPHRAALAVPMVIDGEVVGVFGVGAPAGRTFAPAEVRIVESLAAYAAIALRNARLFAAEQAARADSERARQDAEAAGRAKDEFLAMLGHELRNPLAAIMTGSALLDQAATDPAVAAHARAVIARQSRHLVRLVDDLLDVGRVTMGKIVLARAPVDLAALVGAVAQGFRDTGRARGRQLSVQAREVWVDGDETRLEQVVANLLGNAVKFTREGGRIDVVVAPEDGAAVVRITDDGAGIPAAVLPRIFELFVQAEATLDRTPGGLGIGLTLARRLVQLHGGTIEAASDGPGTGSVFTVRLPSVAAPAAPAPATGGAPGAARRRVLLVEDNADVREMTRIALETAGHTVHEAEDGLRGLAAALELRPDVAVVDIGLPGLDGYTLARRLRSEPAGRGIYLVALTGYGQQEDRVRAREAGFDAQLVKPVDPLTLVELVARGGARDHGP
jgi:PAS domain S-box-containing protein